MDIPIILLIIGLISIIASFFFGNFSNKYADELEKVSISLHEETSGLKKRIRAVEEELMIGAPPMPLGKKRKIIAKTKAKPVHNIIINQILSLHSQGYSINEIAKRSSLSNEEVITVLQSKGVVT
ncbi:helix-turn-helix domain-containing protein [Sporosarcina sp. FSL K6-3457]|uniref:helix-turn-helix domain-containing protein n=1 Tax=Sporosarcina sp. FSL K6-3457 TaxID=2978204 RepID=UPI0030F84CE1